MSKGSVKIPKHRRHGQQQRKGIRTTGRGKLAKSSRWKEVK